MTDRNTHERVTELWKNRHNHDDIETRLTIIETWLLEESASSTDGETPGATPTVIVAAHNSVDRDKAHHLCDNVDDHVQMIAALEEVIAAGGGTVLLLAGDYTISSRVVSDVPIEKGIIFRGEGMEATRIKVADGGATNGGGAIQLSGETSGSYIGDFSLDGNKANAATDYGIYLHETHTKFIVANIYVHDFDHSGIVVGTIVGDGVIVNNISNNNTQAGYWLNISSSKIINNIAEGNSSHGIWLHSGSKDNLVVANYVESNGGDGIFLNPCDHCVIADNVVSNNSSDGITVADGGQAATDNVVNGNLVYGNGAYGINLNSPDNFVVGNILHDNTSGAINDITTPGTNVVVHNSGDGTGDHSDVDAASLGSGSATDGQVLTADGAGNATWEDFSLARHFLF